MRQLSVVVVVCFAACSGDDGGGAGDVPSGADADAPTSAGDGEVSAPPADGASEASEASAGAIELHGVVQKGPFVVGSSITVSVLGPTLDPTGKVFTTETANDRGEFTVQFDASGPVAIEGVGYYYNEVTGALSASELTLRAFYVPAGAGTQAAYINMVTHLTTERIKALVAGGMPFAAAVAQAEDELRRGLAVTATAFVPGAGIHMNVAGGDTDDNAYLLAVSAVLLQAAVMRGGSVEANLQELLNRTSLDLADGTLGADLQSELAAARAAVDSHLVAAHLAARFAAIGATEAVPDMDRVLDWDGDGVANANDLCPHLADPEQADRDHDHQGDACDACPDTPCPDRCEPAWPAGGRAADFCYVACGDDAPCDGDDICVTLQVSAAAGVRTTSTCGTPCDPVAGPACAAAEACFPIDRDADPDVWACLPTALHGARAEGAACLDAPDMCGPGLVCGTTFASPLTACRRLCDPLAHDCDCQGLVGSPGVMVCAPPPGALGDPCTDDSCGAGLGCARDASCHDDAACCIPGGGHGEACLAFGACDDPSEACWRSGEVAGTCGGTLASCCMPGGAEGQRCRSASRCDAGLACIASGPLYDCGGGLFDCCVAAGGESELCNSDGSCDPGLACVTANGPASGCPVGFPNCCHFTRANGQTCDAAHPCAAGLGCGGRGAVCKAGVGDYQDCCTPRVGADQNCFAYDHTAVCEDGLRCMSRNAFSCPAGIDYCCLATGGDAEPCSDALTCDDGFACVGNSKDFASCRLASSTCVGGAACPGGYACVHELCVAAGDQGEPCEAGGSCHGELGCVVDGCAGTDPGASCCTAVGGLSEPCAAGETCDPGLACTMRGILACPEVRGQCCVHAATLGEACGPFAPCAPELACIGGVCSPRRPTGEACVSDDQCVSGDACTAAQVSECAAGDATCCSSVGAAGEPCAAGVCDPGLACVFGAGAVCVASSGACSAGSCGAGFACVTEFVGGAARCLAEGERGGPCAAGDHCDGALECHPAGALGCPPGYPCCVEVGGFLQPCDSAGGCDQDLVCRAGLCQALGGLAEGCRGDGSCDAGLVCNTTGYHCPNDAPCCVTALGAGAACNAYEWICAPDLACGPHSAACLQGVSGPCCVARLPAGGDCGGADICAAGLACAAATGANCPNGQMSCCVPAGGAGEPCLPGYTCGSPGLACYQGKCVESAGACPDGGCPAETSCLEGHCLADGVVGSVCFSDGSCQTGARCVTAPTAECWVGNCCVAAGSPGEPCNIDGSCDPGAVCMTGAPRVCVHPELSCCFAAGGQGQPCLAGLTCDPGLACRFDAACQSPFACCLPYSGPQSH